MKILIADDDADDRVFASMAFKEINNSLEVDFVKDGQELIEILSNSKSLNKRMPDLILLDLNMPRKDGRTALKEIKADPQLRDLNIIIFSTSASEADKKYTLALGAKEYIVKPSDYTKLISVFTSISEELMNLS
jgi:two-component system, response regulator